MNGMMSTKIIHELISIQDKFCTLRTWEALWCNFS